MSNFWYDRLGRLALSQNAKQLAEGTNYSYTLYDFLGRITEVGQINAGVGVVSTNTTKVPSQFQTWLSNNATNRYQITKTTYDLPAGSGIASWLVQNPSTLRNRVSYTSHTPGQTGSATIFQTYYNYDIMGNVSTLLQDYGASSAMGSAGQQYKRLDYQYDLISGKVNSVAYQRGKPDAFLHFYQYDAENRLTDVYSSADSVNIEHEAHYSYYKHGPLARTLLGNNQVQGMDYAYTVQGWLKAVNGSTLNPANDMGQDGNTAVQTQQYIGRDGYGYSLHYFEGDYYPINGSTFLTGVKSPLGTSYKGLYNGNISSMAVNIGQFNNPKLYNYTYDQLNRLTKMDVFNGTNTGLNLWTGGLTATTDYQEAVSYDANGNIKTYLRNGYGSTLAMDNLTYNYQTGTNKLTSVSDAVAAANYPNDIDNQAANNYSYDAAGNMLTDQQAGITGMTWSVYGKLLSVTKSSGSITYQYDATGNRISKTAAGITTWYVRDAQGNILTTYSGTNLPLQEQDLYGSSRLGTIANPTALALTAQYLDHLGSGTLYSFNRGKKLYELDNHLGNVLATVSDKKYGTPSGVPSQISYYTPDIKSAQDYYPFGMEMPGRQYSFTYALSFNGKRDDKEANYGYQEYGKREYDKRIGKFTSIDPLTKRYPMQSPFLFASNIPISGIDLNGLEYLPANYSRLEVVNGAVLLKMSNMHTVIANDFKLANEDPKNWAPNEIGIDRTVIQTIFSSPKFDFPDLNLDNTYGANDPNYIPTTQKVFNPTAKSTGQPDKRYAQREIQSGKNGGGLLSPQGLAKTSIALDAIIVGESLIRRTLSNDDVEKATEQLSIVGMAIYDVNQALNSKNNYIPQQYRTPELISDIVNVVLSGVSNKRNKEVERIGLKIYNDFSKKRFPYAGDIIIRLPGGEILKSIPNVNSQYDPKYGKP